MAPEGWCSTGNDKASPLSGRTERGQVAGQSGKNQQRGRRRGAEYEGGHGTGTGAGPRLRITQKESRAGSNRPLRRQGGADYFASRNS